MLEQHLSLVLACLLVTCLTLVRLFDPSVCPCVGGIDVGDSVAAVQHAADEQRDRAQVPDALAAGPAARGRREGCRWS